MEFPADSSVDSGAGTGRRGGGRVSLGLKTAGFGAALVIFIAVSWIGFLRSQRLLEAARWRAHAEDVIGEIRGLLATLLDAEAAMRGFVITGDERFLDPYHPAVGDLRERLETLRSLIQDQPGAQRRLDDLEPLIAARIRSAEAVIALRRDRGQDAAAAAIAGGEGKGLTDRLRALLFTMEDEEGRLLEERQRTVESSTFRTNCALFGGGALSVFLLVRIVLALQREIREHSRVE